MPKNTREPQQARSIEKKTRILDAAMNQFDEHGFDGTNAKTIAKAAGVSIGTFYAYFTDKKALLMDVFMRHLDEVDQSVLSRMDQTVREGASGREIVRIGLKVAHATHIQQPGFMRMMLGMRYTDNSMRRFMEAEDKVIHVRLHQLLESLKPRLRVTDIEAAVTVVEKAIEEIVHASIVFDAPIEQSRIDDALVDMIATYLFKEPDARA